MKLLCTIIFCILVYKSRLKEKTTLETEFASYKKQQEEAEMMYEAEHQKVLQELENLKKEKSEIKSADTAALKSELEKSKALLLEMQKERDELKATEEQYEEEHTKVQTELEKCKTSSSKYEEEIGVLVHKIQTLEKQLVESNRATDEANKIVAALRAEIEHLQNVQSAKKDELHPDAKVSAWVYATVGAAAVAVVALIVVPKWKRM